VFWPGRGDVDGVGPVDDDVGPAVGERYVLEPDVEVGVGVPVRSGGGIEGVREDPGEAVVPLRWSQRAGPRALLPGTRGRVCRVGQLADRARRDGAAMASA
jgi:hypothetical protein